MRRIFTILVLCTTLLAVSCELEAGDKRDISKLGKVIWCEAKCDIKFVSDALIELLNLNYVLSIDDPKAQETYLQHYFGNNTRLVKTGNNSCTLETTLSYGTTRTTTYKHNSTKLGEGVWTVTRRAGDSYSIILEPTDDNRIKATFTSINYVESEGKGELMFRYEYVNDENNDYPSVVVYYSGYVEMVDGEQSTTLPITLRTDMDYECCYRYNNMGYGDFDITCHDEMLEATDKISVTVIPAPNKHIIISCYGREDVYYSGEVWI